MFLGTALLAGGSLLAAPAAGIDNGSFESSYQVGNPDKAIGDGGFGCWKAGESKRIPAKWLLNKGYPGTADMVIGKDAADGKNYIKLSGNVNVKYKRGAHIYVFAKGLAEGKKYRITAKVRNGNADIGFYEYKLDKTMKAVTVCKAVDVPAGKWVEISGEYTVPANFKNAYLAVMVPWQKSVEIDDIKLVEITQEGK